MEDLKPNAQRAQYAIILIWIVLATDILSVASSFLQYNLLQNAANGGEISPGAAESNDLREQISGIISLVVYFISAITFIQWFRRAYFNLHTKVQSLGYTEGWAAGSWFTPIYNLYVPYQIMKELYQKTQHLLSTKGQTQGINLSTRYLGAWWALWVISNLLGQFLFRYSQSAESISELTNSTIAQILSNIIGIPLALITVKIISDYAKAEPLLYTLNGDGENSGHDTLYLD